MAVAGVAAATVAVVVPYQPPIAGAVARVMLLLVPVEVAVAELVQL